MSTNRTIIEAAFPFHILLDHDLRITSLGDSLVKLGYDPARRPALTEVFRIRRPLVEAAFSAIIEHSSSVFLLEDLSQRLALKGQMVEVGSHGAKALAFLGSPVLHSLDNARQVGLRLSDFALHDSTLDYLVLMQIQESGHNDTKRLAETLLEETQARRKAQEVLEHTNLTLESTVLERTEALSNANRQLEDVVRRLNASNMDLRTLNMVDATLHRCQTVEEAFPTVIQAIRKLFPESSGHIACHDDDSELFKVSAQWGRTQHRLGATFRRDECPAIASHTTYAGHGPRKGVACPELENMGEDEYYTCRPLQAGGSVLGLLHFHYGSEPAPDDRDAGEQRRHTLATTLAEHMALGLSNIRLRQKLEEESIRDPMTRLFNRRYMTTVLERELARAQRHTHHACGVILLDVDHFKMFNDTHGHQAGDRALVRLASLLSSQVRKGDVVCRYGGEEFLLILNHSSMEDAARRAEAIRAAAEQLRIAHDDACLRITISAGVTGFRPGDDMDSVIRRADHALYEAKQQGRNRVVAS